MLMPTTLPKIGPGQKPYVDKVLADPLFPAGSTHRVLFDYLVKETLKEGFEQRHVEQVALDYFGPKYVNAVSRFGVQKSRLKKRLDRYYLESGRAEPVMLRLSQNFCYVGWEQRPAHAPELTWRRQFADTEKTSPSKMLEFKRYLEEHSTAEGTTAAERDDRLVIWAKGQHPFDDAGVTGLDSFFEYLRVHNRSLIFREMRSLVEAIGIHRLMLDPLFSETTPADVLLLRLPSSAEPYRDRLADSVRGAAGEFGTTALLDQANQRTYVHGESHYGHGTVYGVPSRKIAESDSAFVFLSVAPGGYSTTHHHPGDELVLVLHGTISVLFEDSGLTCEMRKGSFAHFYAEQNHSIRNSSGDEAHLFIIRFYQFNIPQTRQSMREELWKQLRQPRPQVAPKLDDLTWGWIMNSAADRSIKKPLRDEVPDAVSNGFGLARFLKRSGGPLKAAALTQFLDAAAAESGLEHRGRGQHRKRYATVDEWLWELESSQARLPRKLIPSLVKLYGVFDLLACEFLFPSVPRHVVVHAPEDGATGDWVDMSTVVRKLDDLLDAGIGTDRGAALLLQKGVEYDIPKRSLACADVAISRLRLQAGFHTTDNTHPGYELLIPTEGTVVVEYYDDRDHPVVMCTLSAQTSIAHYNSRRRHRIRNDGSVPATMFLIRFYGEGADRPMAAPAATAKKRPTKPRTPGSPRTERMRRPGKR